MKIVLTLSASPDNVRAEPPAALTMQAHDQLVDMLDELGYEVVDLTAVPGS